jgi:hypothetical protein
VGDRLAREIKAGKTRDEKKKTEGDFVLSLQNFDQL